MNMIGKQMYMGNRYTFVGFYTQQERDNFCSNETMKKSLGAFRALRWKDVIDKKIVIRFSEIPNTMDEDILNNYINNNFGKIVNIEKRVEDKNKNIEMDLLIDVKCSEKELMDMWAIVINNHMIKVKPSIIIIGKYSNVVQLLRQ